MNTVVLKNKFSVDQKLWGFSETECMYSQMREETSNPERDGCKEDYDHEASVTEWASCLEAGRAGGRDNQYGN